MNIEHLTLGGTSVIRDTGKITEVNRTFFNPIRLGYENKNLILSGLPFNIDITATKEGATFGLKTHDKPMVINVCCFDKEYSNVMLEMVKYINGKLLFNAFEIVKPAVSQWLYSALLNPLAGKEDLMIAGEVELYIYDQLCKAKKDKFQ